METRANYILIGLFTLAVVAAAFGFVYWFQYSGGVSERAVYRIVFAGPVSGLRTGSAVVFNGIRVGEVTGLHLDSRDPRKVEATIAIDPNAPVRADTRITLEFQGLTGIASLSLRGGSPDAPAIARRDAGPPVLTAESGATQDMTETVREVLHRFEKIVSENEPLLHNALRNLDTFTAGLARNTDRIDRVAAGVEALIGSPEEPGELTLAARAFRDTVTPIKELADGLNARTTELPELMTSVRRLAENFDRRTGDIPELVASARRFTDNLDRHLADVPALLKSYRQLADGLDERTAGVPKMIASVQQLAESIDKRTADFPDLLRSFDRLAQNLDRRTADVPELIASVRKFADNLDRRLVEIPELVTSVRKLADGLDTRTAEVPEMIASVRQLAEQMDKRTAGIPDLVTSFRDLAQNIDNRTTEVPELVAAIRQFAQDLDARTGEVPELIASVRNFTDNLDRRTAELPELVASLRQFADGLGKSGSGLPGLMTSLNSFADNLEKRTADIAASVMRLTNTGTRQIEALAADGRRTLGSIDRAVRSLERNPQRLIFGGSENGVPEYNGRR